MAASQQGLHPAPDVMDELDSSFLEKHSRAPWPLVMPQLSQEPAQASYRDLQADPPASGTPLIRTQQQQGRSRQRRCERNVTERA
jgi:hypothetical protein